MQTPSVPPVPPVPSPPPAPEAPELFATPGHAHEIVTAGPDVFVGGPPMVHEWVAGAFGIAAALLLVTTIAFLVLWLRARERAIRAEARALPRPGDGMQLHRIEQAVEAMAIEVERLAEAERFQARLLAERVRPGLAEPPRHVTPH